MSERSKPAKDAQEKPKSPAAQERLAAALRENLVKRKAQARARDQSETARKPDKT